MVNEIRTTIDENYSGNIDIRPVIILKNNITTSGGDGTEANPWRLAE